MKSSQVCWLEGSLVLPHHFQAEVTNLQYWANANINWTTPFHYGLCKIDFELGSETLTISHLKARLRDGSMISVPENATIHSLNFKQPLEQAGVDGLYLYLTLPDYRPGRANAVRVDESEHTDDDQRRYFIQQREWQDVNFEDDVRTIDFYDFNVRIKCSTTPIPPDGFTSIPLLKILPPTKQNSAASIDPNFFPPLLSCCAWPDMKQLLGQIESLIASFIKQQSAQLTLMDAWNHLTQPSIQRAIIRQSAANGAYSVLSSLIGLTRWSCESRPLHVLHPFQMYQEIVRLIGQLGIVEQDWIAPSVPEYDHEKLGVVFRQLQNLLQRLLTPYGPSKLTQYPMIGTADWLEVSIGNLLQDDACEFYIGVVSDMSTADIQRLFSVRHLDWKLGSRSTIGQIYKNAEPGLRLNACVDCPPDLPNVAGRTYFHVESTGEYWEDLKKDPTLALWFNPRHVQGSFLGSNFVNVVDQERKTHKLELSLYVVQHESLVSNQNGSTNHDDA
ncbi:MAG: type VI secretion system baseplate subunit TssK [Pirellulaceae bacterium]|nr:type VI secretion system baseplate subunit TssK [Pirellulaceae bacterium]